MSKKKIDHTYPSFANSFKDYVNKLAIIKAWFTDECQKLRRYGLTYYDMAMHDDIPVVVAELNDRFNQQVMYVFGKYPNKLLFKQELRNTYVAIPLQKHIDILFNSLPKKIRFNIGLLINSKKYAEKYDAIKRKFAEYYMSIVGLAPNNLLLDKRLYKKSLNAQAEVNGVRVIKKSKYNEIINDAHITEDY